MEYKCQAGLETLNWLHILTLVRCMHKRINILSTHPASILHWKSVLVTAHTYVRTSVTDSDTSSASTLPQVLSISVPWLVSSHSLCQSLHDPPACSTHVGRYIYIVDSHRPYIHTPCRLQTGHTCILVM